MKSICFYFQVHQPFRLRTYRFFDIGKNHHYYDEYFNRMIMRRVAEKCYLPMNDILMKHIGEFGANFKVSFSITGLAIEQMELYAPEAIDSFRRLVATGNVEILAETYAHSLSALKDPEEFERQVTAHSRKVEEVFGVKPVSFRNTELIYSDKIGAQVADMGFKVMLTEGAKHILGWKSPNYMYANAINPKLKVLLRNFRLSDDITFRFSQQSWPEWPITAEKFVGWLNKINPKEEVVNLFLDYETFGEHQWASTGIFDFMKALPGAVFSHSEFKFSTPALLAEKLQPVSAIQVPYPVSWADEERDVTAWLGNDLQDESFDKLYSLGQKVRQIDDPDIQRDWNYLQSSDHFYYMCTKWFSDGDVHKYFNHYPSPYEAYINYMNVLSDFMIRVEKHQPDTAAMLGELIEKGSQFVKMVGAQAGEQLEKASGKAKQAIKKGEEKVIPVFDDIRNLSDAKIKKLVKDLEAEDLVAALKDAEQELVNKVLPNLSRATRKKFEDLQHEMKVTKKSAAQIRKQIEDKLKALF
ncbi:MAG: polysaccharide deacetylase family protein [Bacteroidetes bacterium]|nr:polysaccharide deacetylase family protein [Bacteroidota bacterium]